MSKDGGAGTMRTKNCPTLLLPPRLAVDYAPFLPVEPLVGTRASLGPTGNSEVRSAAGLQGAPSRGGETFRESVTTWLDCVSGVWDSPPFDGLDGLPDCGSTGLLCRPELAESLPAHGAGRMLGTVPRGKGPLFIIASDAPPDASAFFHRNVRDYSPRVAAFLPLLADGRSSRGPVGNEPSLVERWLSSVLAFDAATRLALELPRPAPSGVDLDDMSLALAFLLQERDIRFIVCRDEPGLALALDVLVSLSLSAGRGIEIVSCPTCGRCRQDLAAMVARLEQAVKGIDAALTVAVMGCEVNGPGEARHADCGLAACKSGAVIFRKGEKLRKAAPEEAVEALLEEIMTLAGKKVEE